MTPTALLPSGFRLALVIGGGVALVVALAALALGKRERRGAGVTTLLLVVAGACLGIAAIDPVIGWWLERRMPSGDFDESHWLLSGPWGAPARIGALLAAIAVVVMAWIGSSRVSNPIARATLVSLRAGAAVCALCLFFQPAIELRQVTREPNRVAVLVDDSQSMSLSDRAGEPSRLERAKKTIESSRPTFEGWRDRHRVDFFRFSDVTTPADSGLSSLTGVGPATLMRSALEDIRARYQGRDLAGVVMVSDGIATGELADGAAGEMQAFLRSIDAPVHTVMAASTGLIDVAIADVYVDEFAFVRTVFRVEAIIRSTNIDAGRVRVTLAGEGRPLRHKWVELPKGGGEARVAFELTPAKLGRYVYEISVPVQKGEVVTSNNRRPFVVRVIRDKVRVLQVAGSPSWDVRALRGMLKRNPNADLISFFILRTDLDITAAPNNELSLIRFPTRELFLEELPSFDLVVLQNFNFGPYGIAPYLENIRAYVEGGGALAVLGGPLAFASGGYSGTPIGAALPVSLPSTPRRLSRPVFDASSPLIDTAEFRPKLSSAGKSHPVTALRHLPGDNLKAWAALAPLEGINRVRGLRRGSVALAVHPSEKTPDGKAAPVIVAGQYGEGRTLAVMTDSLWRWGFVEAQLGNDDGRAYGKFWENATRWLLDDPDFRYLRAESDRVTYEPGQVASIDVRLLGRDYKPAAGTVSLTLSRGADPTTAEPLAKVEVTTDERGRGTHEIGVLEPGVYRALATADVDGYRADSRDVFVVREASAELDAPAANAETLERVALLTGGQYLGRVDSLPAGLPLGEPRIVRVDRRSELELWSRPWLLLAALFLLGIEWGLRQKWGYR